MNSHQLIYRALAVSVSLAMLLAYLVWWRHVKLQFAKATWNSLTRQASDQEIVDLERSIGGALPETIIAAYQNGSLLNITLPAVFSVKASEFTIAKFAAPYPESNKAILTTTQIDEDAFVFAIDDFGNYYFLRANDHSLYFWDHELGIDLILESVEMLWSLLGTKTM